MLCQLSDTCVNINIELLKERSLCPKALIKLDAFQMIAKMKQSIMNICHCRRYLLIERQKGNLI